MNTTEALRMAGVAIDGLATIERWTQIGGKPAEVILGAIKAALAAIHEGLDGKITSQAALAKLDDLHAKVSTDDNTADAELAAHFKPGS